MSVLPQFQRDAAYGKLLELILSGGLPADRPLSERKLAETLAIGRTPVREAIRALAGEGLLEIRPARGTYLRGIQVEELRELYEVRQALEGHAAYLAAERGPTPDLSAYRDDFLRARRSRVDWDGTDELGAAFHADIARAAGNGLLAELESRVDARFRAALRTAPNHDKSWSAQAVEDHLAILDAIEARQPAAARRLMCEHLERCYQVKRRMLAEMKDTVRSRRVTRRRAVSGAGRA